MLGPNLLCMHNIFILSDISQARAQKHAHAQNTAPTNEAGSPSLLEVSGSCTTPPTDPSPAEICGKDSWSPQSLSWTSEKTQRFHLSIYSSHTGGLRFAKSLPLFCPTTVPIHSSGQMKNVLVSSQSTDYQPGSSNWRQFNKLPEKLQSLNCGIFHFSFKNLDKLMTFLPLVIPIVVSITKCDLFYTYLLFYCTRPKFFIVELLFAELKLLLLHLREVMNDQMWVW